MNASFDFRPHKPTTAQALCCVLRNEGSGNSPGPQQLIAWQWSQGPQLMQFSLASDWMRHTEGSLGTMKSIGNRVSKNSVVKI